jgi:predicted  nucleic acid-binding Zn-ribbon protein
MSRTEAQVETAKPVISDLEIAVERAELAEKKLARSDEAYQTLKDSVSQLHKELAEAVGEAARLRDIQCQKDSIDRGYSLEKEVQRLQVECDRWMKQALEKPADNMQRAEALYEKLQSERRTSEKLKGVVALLLDLGAPKSETYPFEQNSPFMAANAFDELVKEAGLGSLGK